MTSNLIVDKPFLDLLAALVAGGGYVGLSLLRKRCWPRNTFRLFATALAGSGIVASLWLVRIALIPSADLRKVAALDELRFYLGLGGMAVGWISGLTIVRSWQSAWAPGRPTLDAEDVEESLTDPPVQRR